MSLLCLYNIRLATVCTPAVRCVHILYFAVYDEISVTNEVRKGLFCLIQNHIMLAAQTTTKYRKK